MKIFVAILVFSFLMIIHELGHFLMAKRLGIKAYELSIGMGPKIFGIEKGNTQYNLRLIPFGAYVRFGDEEDEFFAEPDNFMNKPAWDRIKVVIMGPVVNLVTALLLMIGGIYYNGFPTNTIGSVSENLPAERAGITAGDTILSIEGIAVSSWTDVIQILSNPPEDKIVDILVQKSGGEEKLLTLQMEEHEGRYMVGFSPKFERHFLKSVQYGTLTTIEQSTMMVDTIKQLFIGRANIEEFTGPVGIVTVVGEATEAGWLSLLFLTALLSLNLGILNLIPIPGLDGSKILFYGYEAITKKPVNRSLEVRLTMLGFFLIIGFSIFITYKDVLRLLTKS